MMVIYRKSGTIKDPCQEKLTKRTKGQLFKGDLHLLSPVQGQPPHWVLYLQRGLG